MATSYSTNLALALPVTGELSGTWGTVVNSNITNMLDEALGYQAYTATGGADTITIPDGTTGVARSIYIQLNGTGGGSVAVPTAKTKMYFVFNNTASAITFKVTGQTGVSIPAAAKIALVSNGTDIITAENYFAALTLGAALPVASGGTSLTTLTANNVILGNGTSAPTFVAPSTNGNVLTSNGTTWVSSAGASVSAATPTALGTVYAKTNNATAFETFLGYQAGRVSTGVANTAVGYQAGYSITYGTNNTCIGYQAGYSTTNMLDDICIGYQAGFIVGNNGSLRIAIGKNAGRFLDGTNVIAIGNNALYGASGTTASRGVAVGVNSQFSATSGTDNTAVGADSMYSITTGNLNSAFGESAGYAITTGTTNTTVGRGAGATITTGSNNLLLGYNATATSGTVSNENTFGNSSTTSNRFWGDMKMGGSAAGTSGQVLTSAGAGVAPTWATVSAGFTLATPVASTSGTSIDFTGIPAGVKQVLIMFSGVSTNTSSTCLIQLGDAGGIETSGYVATSTKIAASVTTVGETTGFPVSGPNTAAANALSGTVTLSLENTSAFRWLSGGLINAGNEASVFASAGRKALSQELNSIRLTTVGGDTFDAGEINIAYI